MIQEEATLLRDDYVLGRSAEEYERLCRQAQALEPATRRIFESIRLRSGLTCLDVGCGPGEVMRLMGEFVGASGEVTGLDRDGPAGREAVKRLRASGTGQYRFIEANMEEVDQIDSPLFDLTFARLALLYARDPVAVLRGMYKKTKPGGYIVIQDYHLRTASLYPKIEAFSELLHIVLATFERSGQDLEFAAKLPAYFVEAGIGTPDGTDTHLPLTSFRPFNAMIQAVGRSLLPKSLELGIATEAQMRRVLRDIQQALDEETYYSALWPLMIGVWKRKPV